MRRLILVSSAVLAGCLQDYSITKPPGPGPDLGSDSDDALPLPDTDETDPSDTDDSGKPPVDDPPAVPAQLSLYAHTRDTLYSVEPATGAVTSIGTFRDGGTKVEIVDIAIERRGVLYAGSLGSGGKGRRIFLVDPTTAALTEVCEVQVDLTAMTFTSDGRLILGGEDVLRSVDLSANCRVTTLFQATGLDVGRYKTSGDVVALPDGLIYWTVRSGLSDQLAVVDPASGDASLVGSVLVDRIFGLGYDEGEGALYGFSADGEIVSIDPATADAEVIGEDEDLGWWGATTNPVLWAP